MAREEIIPYTDIESQLLAHLPVILSVRAYLQIPPVPEIISQLRWLIGDKARVDAGDQPVRRIRREENLVEEVIRWPRDVEFAVLDVPSEIPAELEIVFALLKTHHVAAGIDFLFNELRI